MFILLWSLVSVRDLEKEGKDKKKGGLGLVWSLFLETQITPIWCFVFFLYFFFVFYVFFSIQKLILLVFFFFSVGEMRKMLLSELSIYYVKKGGGKFCSFPFGPLSFLFRTKHSPTVVEN